MTYYYKLGQLPHKHHTQFRQPDGSLYHEEVMGIHGFAGIQSILYHLRPPTQVRRVDVETQVKIDYEEPGPLRPRHLCTAEITEGGGAIGGRHCLRSARLSDGVSVWMHGTNDVELRAEHYRVAGDAAIGVEGARG